ncbi:TnsA-like heteromeric transposase endonuclease subunit [Zafaria sp. Z1313]|uniref:TnsA-like heteromeric transposase endonuclease subunit n=1 Tax=unclassified Zafaria TaxID=2828765 RepID=UPI002E77F74C|nr:TnsA-like heteromeric transposase endonuclease subunit [Zafaria sp. J156]MEE1622727.1 TnsA-like heteromeric transposase endonuclease subunit [Zafaria sp. J156]
MKAGKQAATADPYRNLANPNDHPVIAWTDAAGAARTSVADARCLRHGLETARRARRPANYQHRRNYEGYYWWAGSGESVWYESMTEYAVLMELDHSQRLAKVAAQPFCILFNDGARHYPDYFALHASGSQVVYDVRPADRIDEKAEMQFAKTREVCEQIGWGYEVLHGATGVQRHNLEWLAGYRHPYITPEAPARSRILRAAEERLPLATLAAGLDPELPARFIPAIYHLLWARDLTYNPSKPLGWNTLIGRSSRG